MDAEFAIYIIILGAALESEGAVAANKHGCYGSTANEAQSQLFCAWYVLDAMQTGGITYSRGDASLLFYAILLDISCCYTLEKVSSVSSDTSEIV